MTQQERQENIKLTKKYFGYSGVVSKLSPDENKLFVHCGSGIYVEVGDNDLEEYAIWYQQTFE